MEDLFDEQYADELDALGDFEDYPLEPRTPKSKKTLQFTTPNNKSTNNASATEDFGPLPSTPIEGRNKQALSTGGAVKRPRNNRISDSEDDMDNTLTSLGQKSKRARVEEQNEFDDIECPPSPPKSSAPHYRQHTSHRVNKVVDDHDFDGADDYEMFRPRVLSRIPTNSEYISITGLEGQRAYMHLRKRLELEKQYESVGINSQTSQLLAIPVSVLKYEAEEERQRKIIENAEKIIQTMNSEEDISDIGADDGSTSESQQSLWVEKYRPEQYTDLLSEENLNRSLLCWLKLWDYVVFGKDLPAKWNQKKDEPKQKKWRQPEVLNDLDQLNRPVQKIVLLCGPPGLGKTTLAHVVAKHAGYNVVEMNASDDRSAAAFQKKLEDSTQMKSVLGNDQRPNCLVIDEIDGAPQPAINILLKLIQRTDQSSTKKKNEGSILFRPIICICNDQYVPALRQLRQSALMLPFPPTESTKLAGRLHQIVKEENIKAEMNALLALCEKSGNDIRACLNTLQFVRQQKREFTLRVVQGMPIGQKDSHKSLFSLWYELFTMPRLKKNKFISIDDLQGQRNTTSGNNTTMSNRFQTVMHSVYAAGEYEKVMQGVFENYLEAKCKDPKMDALTSVNEWLCFVDEINQYIQHKQDYSLMPYIPFMFVNLHLLYASYQPPKIKFPHTHYEYTVKLSKMTNLCMCMLADMLPKVKKYVDTKTAALDILHPLLQIFHPMLRPVNTQLYSKREKDEMANLVQIMIAYNMTYHQEKAPEGQYVYMLDPNVEEIVKFPGMKQNRQLTYAAKQLIAREIELERIRMNEQKIAKNNSSGTSYLSEKSTLHDDNLSVVPNHKKKLDVKEFSEEKPAKDFFGNFIKTKRSTTVNTTKEALPKVNLNKKDVLATDIWFHFKEGFSNAVRRNVRIHDFL